jgi:hypothetical protein
MKQTTYMGDINRDSHQVIDKEKKSVCYILALHHAQVI